jgi:uncharacterized protein YndB with AHSA1/START domain
MKNITISVLVEAPLERVWECWTRPEYITKWNHASEAENDLRVGGRFSSRMEAKDGSEGFDFGGMYTKIEPLVLIESILDDNRQVTVTFIKTDRVVLVTETFEMENENSEELQRMGWQAILNSFKLCAETGG